jgi:tetratricopeptide (TPR) repeat protein
VSGRLLSSEWQITAVAKKHKHRGPPVLTPAMLASRVERAVHEGRYQQALDLGKQLYKQDPSPPHRDLLRKVYLGRAEQLRKQGHTRDARTVLDSAVRLADGSDPVWLERLAEEIARCGDIAGAFALLGQIPGFTGSPRILAQAADWAILNPAPTRTQLPEPLQPQLDLVLTAFQQTEAGQDEAARTALQAIGLQSPFLEWKVMLRGLTAYYQKDDVRALENWHRLDAERLPARLVAPLRFALDSAYRQAQSPDAQAALQKQGDRLQASGLVQPLRNLQAALANSEQLPRAFRMAEDLLSLLRQQVPQVIPRLAACFFWTIISSGEPEDVHRYQRVFGTPADDPHLARLRALLYEHAFDLDRAHTAWQELEKAVAAHPASWPSDQATRVRALIWCHLGRNAEKVPDQDKIDMLPPFLRDHPQRPRPLSPSAEKCFQRSLELAPDQLETHVALFQYYRSQKKNKQAEKAARELLRHFPEHVPTLEALGTLRIENGAYVEGLELLQKALRGNPLDRGLRSQVGTAHLFNARSQAEAGQFDQARAEYQAALAYWDQKDRSSVYCKWAACEFKAGQDARAEELVQQAQTEAGSDVAVAFGMLIEAIRLKLRPALKTRFNKAFTGGLAEPPTSRAAASLAEIARAHHVAGFTYHGQKTHEKKVLAYVEKASKADFTEDQLETLCRALLSLEAARLISRFTALGKRQFPCNPYFYFLEAESYFAKGPYGFPIWQVQPLLSKARELAQQLPADDKQQALLLALEERQQLLGATSFLNGPGPMGMLEDNFDMMDEYEDDEEFYDDDDY